MEFGAQEILLLTGLKLLLTKGIEEVVVVRRQEENDISAELPGRLHQLEEEKIQTQTYEIVKGMRLTSQGRYSLDILI